MEMDRKIWKNLPIELLERILSFLPLKTFLSLRPTCKYFNSLIFSPNFISKHTNSSSLSSFLLLSHPQSSNYLLYDTVLKAWRDITLPLSCTTPLLSISTSLFCYSDLLDSSNSGFVLRNLLAKSSRFVTFPDYPFAFQYPTLVTNANGYKLFCLSSTSGFGLSRIYAYVYDSRSRNWTRFHGFQRSLGDSYHQQGVCFDGSLYFATRAPFSVVSFDMFGKWEMLEVDLPHELTFLRLTGGTNENGNRLFMFGGIGSNGISRSMRVWELDRNERKWNEIESVPDMMCRKFGSVCYHNYEHIYCFTHQDMICVCCYTWPEVLYYKVSRRTWHWLPKCPSLPDKWSCGFKWFSFAPHLYAYV